MKLPIISDHQQVGDAASDADMAVKVMNDYIPPERKMLKLFVLCGTYGLLADLLQMCIRDRLYPLAIAMLFMVLISLIKSSFSRGTLRLSLIHI